MSIFITNISYIEKTIKCFDDCHPGGCPGHKVKLQLNGVTCSADYYKDDKLIFSMDSNEGDALFEILTELKNNT
ncbi:MAG TPA: hypothetical protein VN922_07975 [Bacteroidia bacterium]|nr:hypothetical protein [Bacteroidia bacterium]